MKEMNNGSSKGSTIVEATIYFPIVICMLIALVMLAMFNMQEYLMMYEAQRVSSVVSRNVAYRGYSSFAMGENNEIDFSNNPSSEQVKAYYDAYHKNPRALYREIGGLLASGGLVNENKLSYQSNVADAAARCSMIAIGTVSSPDVKVDSGLFGDSVTVTFTHHIPVPGVLRFLGYRGSTDLRVAAYNYSVNPSEFVRNVDFASDMIDYFVEKMGLASNFAEFKSKMNKVLDIII